MADGLDPRTPVIIGTGQLNQRVDRGAEVLEPVDLMAEALRIAEADTGSSRGAGPGRLRARALRAVVALRRSRHARGRAARRVAPAHALHGHGRQLRPDGRHPGRGRDPGRPGRCRARDRRRGLALAHGGPVRG